MKIVIYISHPAQYLFYRNPIRLWQEHGHTLKIFIRTKDVLEQLLHNDKLEYENIMPNGRKADKYNIAKAFALRTTILYFKTRRFRPDILLGTDASVAHIAFLLRKPCITTLEDDYSVIKRLALLTFPFTSTILVPEVCQVGRWNKKKIGYAGYMKLAYLHPDYFTTTPTIIDKHVGNLPYCLIRLSRLMAYHDLGMTGLTTEIIQKIIALCKQYNKNIFISSEGKLSSCFENYQLKIEPADMHHLLAGADLLISDSQSMSVEAAMLGVPSLRFSDFSGKISVLEELEHTYRLTFGFTTSFPDQMLRLAEELLADKKLKIEFQKRRYKMLADKIDVTNFATWFVENYPASRQVMQAEPELQYCFQSNQKNGLVSKSVMYSNILNAKRDFTLTKYKELLLTLQQSGFEFRTFEAFCKGDNQGRFVLLRHDVDARPDYSLQIAELEHAMGIRSTYYFRIVSRSNHPEVIRSIVQLNHEIGYHYENLSKMNGDIQKSIVDFKQNLNYFRQYYPVQTISMHGSPMSKYDNRDLWKLYDYKELGIVGEPYFDVDFSQMMYLTDTGRCWNGQRFSFRDKVEGGSTTCFESTDDIIAALRAGMLPDKIMITTHPQRWTGNNLKWVQEYVTQNLKNKVKQLFIYFQK